MHCTLIATYSSATTSSISLVWHVIASRSVGGCIDTAHSCCCSSCCKHRRVTRRVYWLAQSAVHNCSTPDAIKSAPRPPISSWRHAHTHTRAHMAPERLSKNGQTSGLELVDGASHAGHTRTSTTAEHAACLPPRHRPTLHHTWICLVDLLHTLYSTTYPCATNRNKWRLCHSLVAAGDKSV